MRSVFKVRSERLLTLRSPGIECCTATTPRSFSATPPMQHAAARLLSPTLRRSLARAFRPAHARAFTVLALESSADDTCAAVVTSDRKVLSNVVISQQAL